MHHPEDTSGFQVLDLDGHGDGMQVTPLGEVLVAHLEPSGKGTTISTSATQGHEVRQYDR
jgi:hypothetical protein